MAKNIDPQLKLISDYLKLTKSENFVIPEYQKAYSWDITQCDKLWQDIEAYCENGGEDPYFFGTIIVDCSQDAEGTLSLIDGQQRTTTFILLLKAILLRLNEIIPQVPNDEDSEPLKDGLKENRKIIMTRLFKAEVEDVSAILKDPTKMRGVVILKNDSINELYKEEVGKIVEAPDFMSAACNVHKIPRKQKDNKYTNHFRNFKFFYSKLQEKDSTQLNAFAKTVLKKCQVIEIRSWQIEQAITMFNSLNSTGMPLSDSDIISAQLYSKSGEKKSEFNQQWTLLTKIVDGLQSRKIINLDGVLQHLMYIKRAESHEYISDKGKGNVSVDVTTPGLRRYYTEINKTLLDEPLTLCKELIHIATAWDCVKDFPIVKLLLKCNENAKLYLSCYMSRFAFNDINDITEENLSEICKCFLRLFIIQEVSDLGYSSSKFKTFLFRENVKIVDKTIPVSEIVSDFSSHIGNSKNWTIDDVKSDIEEYQKHLLVFVNEYLFSMAHGVPFDFADNVNIEHIMPASGKDKECIRKDAGIETLDVFEEIVNLIGNKILLEEEINKSIGKAWFMTKKQSSVTNKTGYQKSHYALARSLVDYPKDTWTVEDIKLATDKAVTRILKFIFD